MHRLSAALCCLAVVAVPFGASASPLGYRTAVEASMPLLNFHFDDDPSMGTAEDSGPSGLDGTYSDANVTASADPFCEGGIAFAATGMPATGGRITVPHNSALDLTTAVSIEAIIEWGGPNPDGTQQRIAERSTESSNNLAQYALMVNEMGQLRAEILTSDATPTVIAAVGTTDLSDGPHHVAMTYDGTTLRVYVDGVQEGESAGGNNLRVPAEPRPLGIGNPTDRQRPFVGIIDELALYDFALDARDLELHAFAAALADCSPGVARNAGPEYWAAVEANDPVANYHLADDVEAGTLSDATANSLDGTYSDDAVTTASAAGNIAECGQGVTFTGGRATVPHSPLLDFTTAVTIETVLQWAGPNEMETQQRVVERSTESANTLAHYGLSLTNEGIPLAEVRTPTMNVLSVRGTEGLSIDDMAHVVLTYDGSTMTLYVNGTAVATTTGGDGLADLESDRPLGIGNNTKRERPFNGTLEEIAIYGVALSAGDVAAHFSALEDETCMMEEMPDAGPIEDDAGAVESDAGIELDAGTLVDAGGGSDAGPINTDAGAVTPPADDDDDGCDCRIARSDRSGMASLGLLALGILVASRLRRKMRN